MPRRHVIQTVLGLLATLATLGCGQGEGPTASSPAPRPAVVVATSTLAPTLALESFEVSGGLEPWRRVDLASKLLARVDTLTVREGDRVSAGQTLAELEKRDLDAAVAQAEAAVAMAEAELENATAQHQRMTTLRERGSVTAKNLEDATAHFLSAGAALDLARANLEAAQVAVGYAKVVAPFDGWLVKRHIEAGDMATPGRPLLTVEDLSRMKVRLAVPESRALDLEAGTPTTVEILGNEIAAVIDRVVPAGDPASRSFEVQVVLDNPDGRLKSGLFARARLAAGERRLLAVPVSAVVHRGQLDGVFVVSDDRARLRWVEVGQRLDAGEPLLEIVAGLSEGEQIVLSPPGSLRDGDPVETTPTTGGS